MPLILSLIGALVTAVGPIIAQIVLSLGIGFVAFSGLDIFIETFRSQALSVLGGQNSLFTQMMGVFNIGTAVNMIASAYTARLTIAGLTGGSITRMVTRR
jgi:hypothetical protein